jgi:hypothetical protein
MVNDGFAEYNGEIKTVSWTYVKRIL